MYFKQNNAIKSTDRKVLKCHTIELSFKVQNSVIDQEVYFTHCRHQLTQELEVCHWNMVGFSIGSNKGNCLLAGQSDLN